MIYNRLQTGSSHDFNHTCPYIYEAIKGDGSMQDRARKEFVLAALQASTPEWRKISLDDQMPADRSVLLRSQLRILEAVMVLEKMQELFELPDAFSCLRRLGNLISNSGLDVEQALMIELPRVFHASTFSQQRPQLLRA